MADSCSHKSVICRLGIGSRWGLHFPVNLPCFKIFKVVHVLHLNGPLFVNFGSHLCVEHLPVECSQWHCAPIFLSLHHDIKTCLRLEDNLIS